MADRSLADKKIAVLVESEYIPTEIRTYQQRFAEYGATVELMSRLWGNPSLTFTSWVGEAGRTPETLEVTLDLEQANLDDYAAVIMAANYTSVRLRYTDPPASSSAAAETARAAPAVRFFRRAMQNPDIVKAAPCHALWLLTPNPDLLAGRRVTCNPVVLADVVNTGAVYVPPPPGTDWHDQIVVDGDLVTSPSAATAAQSARLVDAVRGLILDRPARQASEPAAAGAGEDRQSQSNDA